MPSSFEHVEMISIKNEYDIHVFMCSCFYGFLSPYCYKQHAVASLNRDMPYTCENHVYAAAAIETHYNRK